MPRYNSGDLVTRNSRPAASRPYPSRQPTRRFGPFSRLSDDVLLNLVECGLPDKDDESRLFYLFHMGTISQALRRVLLGNTKLWRHLFIPNLGNNTKGLRYESYLAMALERSGTQPLSLTVDFRTTPTHRFRRCWEVIQTFYLERCKRLCIMSDNLDDAHHLRMSGLEEAPLETWNPWFRLPPRMSNTYNHSIDQTNWWWVIFPLPPMPNLEEFEVAQGEEESEPLDMFSQLPPKLRSVHINGMFHDSWLDTLKGPALTQLHISPRSEPGLIAQLLAGLPNLERLFLDQDGLDDRYEGQNWLYPMDYTGPDVSLSWIRLERLRDMRITGESALVVASVIVAPKLRSLEVSGCFKARSSPRALSQLLRCSAQSHPALELFALRRGYDYRAPMTVNEQNIASDLANFFAMHTSLKAVILDKCTALPPLFTHLYAMGAARGTSMCASWRLLHIHVRPGTDRVSQCPLPDLKPLVRGNKRCRIEFSDEQGAFGPDEFEWQRSCPDNVKCIKNELWDDARFGTDWYESLIDWWHWDWVDDCLASTRP